MKAWLLTAMMLVTGNVGAQVLTYRNGDPFLFCSRGITDPSRCWWPVQPFTGGAAFMISPLCEPNPYGKPWSADDIASFGQYETVCPVGQRPGGWNPAGGAPEMVPSYH